MALIVQKFGGTSVATPEKIQAAARKAIRTQQEGNQVVVVVSAMGHETDHLIDLARKLNEQPPAREMDMLLSTGEPAPISIIQKLASKRSPRIGSASTSMQARSSSPQASKESTTNSISPPSDAVAAIPPPSP